MTEIEWELWYQDNFDRECPRSVQAVGVGLEQGLVELWSYHLRETVGANGQQGFARFNLWCKSNGQSIEVAGPWQGAVRLRVWVWSEPGQVAKAQAQARAVNLLRRVAKAHAKLVLAKRTSAVILAVAAEARDRKNFEAWLAEFEPDGQETSVLRRGGC